MNDTRRRLGERLIEQEGISQAQSEKYRKEVEKLMEKEIRKLKWQKISYWVVAPLLLLESVWFSTKLDDAATVQIQLRYLFWAIVPFLFVMLMQIQYFANRNTIEIRKEVKELMLAIKELNEKIGK
jgi:p-aminobenzoyl-glutamate transporter AbgT